MIDRLESLRRRYRFSLGIFVAGLVLSGLTAFPLLSELRFLSARLGISDPADFQHLSGLRHWIAFVLRGLEDVHAHYPFMAYGTDWLAFGHLAIALFFVRPFFKPEQCRWVIICGLLCCTGVVPVALIAGAIRGIPFYWRLIDCSFGVFGAIPLWYCLRLTGLMLREPHPSHAPVGSVS